MNFSRLRTLLLTCCFGIAAANAYTRINVYLDTLLVTVPPVSNLPQVKSETPLIIKILCPEPALIKVVLKERSEDKYAGDEDFAPECYQKCGSGDGGRQSFMNIRIFRI